jgi:hypothetical protein
MNLAEFRTELDKLIKKFSLGGVSAEDLADELLAAAADLRKGEAGADEKEGD